MKRSTGTTELGELEKIACPTGPPRGGICVRDPGRMHRRLVGPPGECSQYHVMSRTAGGELLFGGEEKEAMRVLMWRMARFSGVEILTYCVMGNHFHLLVRLPRREQFLRRFDCEVAGGPGEQRLLEHLKLLYSEAYLSRLGREIAGLRDQGREAEVQRVFDRYKARFCDLSLFVKELKERFSRWYNKKHGRRGTLWMDRFRSVVVEDGACLRTMAAYIDLNPVRAGLAGRPEDYRWCGYAEALGGSKLMRRGLCRVLGWPPEHWAIGGRRGQSGGEAYRCLLYEDGIERIPARGEVVASGQARREGIPLEDAREVIARGGALSHFDLVRFRVRWFSEGVAIGSEGFVGRLLGGGSDPGRVKPLPIGAGGGGRLFSLSRLRRRGVG